LENHHDKLSLQQPESTSLTTVSGFKNVVMHTIFHVLENIVNENKIPDLRIFTMDETPHTVFQRPEKIIAQKGNHEV
jgi:hypothetical protein